MKSYFGAIALALLVFGQSGYADGTTVPALAAPAATPAKTPEFVLVDRQVQFSPGYYGNSVVGQSGSTAIGLESKGYETFGSRRGVFQWDTAGAVRASYVPGQAAPGIGIAGNFSAELGYRPLSGTWSPYAGVGVHLGLDGLYIPGQSMSIQAAMNYFKYDGTKDILAARFNLGGSRLDETSMWQFNSFIQQSFRFPESFVQSGPSISNALTMGLMTDVGLHGEYADVKRNLRVSVEGLYGLTMQACTICDRYVVMEGKAGVKKGVTVNNKEIWLGVDLDVESDQLKHAFPEIIPNPAPNVSTALTGTVAIPF